MVASYSFTVAIALLAVIYLIDIIATYLLIPEKQGAPPWQCNAIAKNSVVGQWLGVIVSAPGIAILSLQGESQVIEPPFPSGPSRTAGRHLF